MSEETPTDTTTTTTTTTTITNPPITLAPPELPKEPITPPTTTSTIEPHGYKSVSGASTSVSNTRHNPITDANKDKIEEKKDINNNININNNIHAINNSILQQQYQQQAAAAAQQQQQQQLLAAQMAAAQAMSAQQQLAMLGGISGGIGINKTIGTLSGKTINKYTCWPPPEQQQYLSFHPLGWPIDPDYQYQISNYLGPSVGIPNNNISALSGGLIGGGLGGLGGMGNPLFAAQNVAMNNPLLLAAQTAALNPLNPLLNVANTNNNNINIPNNQTGMPNTNANAVVAAAAASAAAASAAANITGKQYSLFVFHLPEDIDDHGLLQLFAPYGAMRSNVMRHDTGRSRGFGFVHFNTRHEAQIAIDMMNGHQIGRKRLRVSFKREEPHDNKMSRGMIQGGTNEQTDGQ